MAVSVTHRTVVLTPVGEVGRLRNGTAAALVVLLAVIILAAVVQLQRAGA